MSVQEATPPSRGFESQADFTRRVAPQLPSLFRVARRLAPSDDIAWDAVQETLLRVWLSGHLPSEPGPLNHLVRRSTLHQLRCLRRRRYHEDAAAARSEPCCDESPWLEGSEAPHVESLQAALERARPEHREVLELHAIEKESYENIAERLGIPIGTVRSRLSRARHHLRETLTRAS